MNLLVDSQSGEVITKDGSNTRTKVHEYGGRPAAVRGRAVMSDFATNTVYERRMKQGGWTDAVEIVPSNSAYRYADFDCHVRTPF